MSANPRVADYPIDPQFINRWSPRAFSGESIPEETLLGFLEDAHRQESQAKEGVNSARPPLALQALTSTGVLTFAGASGFNALHIDVVGNRA